MVDKKCHHSYDGRRHSWNHDTNLDSSIMKEYMVYGQTQHRIKFNQNIDEFVREGWTLVGPVQFQILPLENNTYYLATFERERNDSYQHAQMTGKALQ